MNVCISPLRWFTAKVSDVYTARPLPIAYERKCIFMPLVVRALDAAGIPLGNTLSCR